MHALIFKGIQCGLLSIIRSLFELLQNKTEILKNVKNVKTHKKRDYLATREIYAYNLRAITRKIALLGVFARTFYV